MDKFDCFAYGLSLGLILGSLTATFIGVTMIRRKGC